MDKRDAGYGHRDKTVHEERLIIYANPLTNVYSLFRLVFILFVSNPQTVLQTEGMLLCRLDGDW